MSKIRKGSFGKIVQGDEVKVKGERGQFTFLSHVTIPDTGEEYVDVYGGANGHLMFRSFDPSRVKPQVRRRKQNL